MGPNHVHLVSQGELDAALFMLRADVETLRALLYKKTEELGNLAEVHRHHLHNCNRDHRNRYRDMTEGIRALGATSDCVITALIKLLPGFGEAYQEALEVKDGCDLELAAEAERMADIGQADVMKLVQDNTWNDPSLGK